MIEVSPVQLYEAHRRLWSTGDGQIVMADLIRHFGFTLKSTIGATPRETEMNEARRTVLLYIDSVTNTDPRTHEVSEADMDGQPPATPGDYDEPDFFSSD